MFVCSGDSLWQLFAVWACLSLLYSHAARWVPVCDNGDEFSEGNRKSVVWNISHARQSSRVLGGLVKLCPSFSQYLGPVHTGQGAPGNRHMQILKHITVNGSVQTAYNQHQRVCTQICKQICLCVLCERGLRSV